MSACIVVADAGIAKIFVCRTLDHPWRFLRELHHPESRIKETDLVEGERGRMRQSLGVGNRPAMEPTTSPHEVEREIFARELTERLDHDFNEHQFEELILVAPPHFLGLLEKSLPSRLARNIMATIDKDFANVPNAEIGKRVRATLSAQR